MAERGPYDGLAEILLRQYSDPSSLRNPLMEISKQQYVPWPTLPPLHKPAEARVYDPQANRPRDVTAPVAEALSPTMGGYGMGQLLADTYGKGKESDWAGVAANSPLLAAMALPVPGAQKAPKVPRKVHPATGFYSHLEHTLDNLPRQKGPAQGFLNDLTKAGVKKAEIEATGLDKFLAGRPNVTRDELMQYLKDNRVQVREAYYSSEQGARADEAALAAKYRSQGMAPDQAAIMASKVSDKRAGRAGDPKWSQYSLDPSNPTYRETVIHLPLAEPTVVPHPDRPGMFAIQYPDGKLAVPLGRGTPERPWVYTSEGEARASPAWNRGSRTDVFRGGHWDEPNVIAHARTSIQKDAQGRPVFLIDELQSDWGQKLRDGGARDEAKIAELRKRATEYGNEYKTFALGEAQQFLRANRLTGDKTLTDPTHVGAMLPTLTEAQWASPEVHARAAELLNRYDDLSGRARLAEAELRTAEAATPGHPLVNTTDQWTTTALRRLIRQANEAGAEGIALTPGQIQNERFNLSNHVSDVAWGPTHPGADVGYLSWRRPDREQWEAQGQVERAKLPDYVGRELAEKLLAQEPVRDPVNSFRQGHVLENLKDVEIGGHGMRHAYDKMYPEMLASQLKRLDPQWPGKAETHLLPSDFDPSGMVDAAGNLNRMSDRYRKWQEYSKGTPYEKPFSYFPLTPKIKEEVAKGLPLFGAAGLVGAPALSDLLRQYDDTP